MNQNRCWPGVPNRYRMSSLSSETRPKSIATVVVVLCGTAARSSTPALASVMTASVVSGTISDTDPTSVVLPAPKPPAMTILAEMCWPDGPLIAPASGAALEAPKSTEHPLQQGEIRLAAFRCRVTVHRYQSRLRHVRYENTRYAERHVDQRRDLGHGPDVLAEVGDLAVLGLLVAIPVAAERGCDDQGLQRQVQARAGPPAGARVRPN